MRKRPRRSGTFHPGRREASAHAQEDRQGDRGPQAADAQAAVSVQGRRADVPERAGGDHAGGHADRFRKAAVRFRP